MQTQKNNIFSKLSRARFLIIITAFLLFDCKKNDNSNEIVNEIEVFTLDNGLYGYRYTNGDTLIKPIYTSAEPFSDGLALVEKDSKKYFIDKTGKVVINITYDEAHSFSEGLALIKKGELYGYIDTEGKEVIKPEYYYAEDFKEGLAGVGFYNKSEYGYIDKTNTMVIANVFTYAYPFSEGLGLVKLGDNYLFIDKAGTTKLKLTYDYVEPFKNGWAKVNDRGKWGFVNKAGNEMKGGIFYGEVQDFENGMAEVTYRNKKGLISTEGNQILPFEFSLITRLSGTELFEVQKLNTGEVTNYMNGGEWGVFDKSGKEIIPVEYQQLQGIRF